MLSCLRGFPGNSAALEARVVKRPPAMQETRVQSLSLEGPPEKGMATHSSILAWKSPGIEEPGRIQSVVLQKESDTT